MSTTTPTVIDRQLTVVPDLVVVDLPDVPGRDPGTLVLWTKTRTASSMTTAALDALPGPALAA